MYTFIHCINIPFINLRDLFADYANWQNAPFLGDTPLVKYIV